MPGCSPFAGRPANIGGRRAAAGFPPEAPEPTIRFFRVDAFDENRDSHRLLRPGRAGRGRECRQQSVVRAHRQSRLVRPRLQPRPGQVPRLRSPPVPGARSTGLNRFGRFSQTTSEATDSTWRGVVSFIVQGKHHRRSTTGGEGRGRRRQTPQTRRAPCRVRTAALGFHVGGVEAQQSGHPGDGVQLVPQLLGRLRRLLRLGQVPQQTRPRLGPRLIVGGARRQELFVKLTEAHEIGAGRCFARA